jgi:hypothetical protein
MGKIVIHNYKVEGARVRSFQARIVQAARDDIGSVFAAPQQARFKFLIRGWQQVDADGIAELVFHLLGALPVDFQHHVHAQGHALLQPVLRGAVEIAMHLCPLKKISSINAALEFGAVNENVFSTVLLLTTRRAGGVRNR